MNVIREVILEKDKKKKNCYIERLLDFPLKSSSFYGEKVEEMDGN